MLMTCKNRDMDLPDDKERDVLGEHLAAKLDAIRENTDRIPQIDERLGRVEERLERLETKADIVGDAVKEHLADKSLHG